MHHDSPDALNEILRRLAALDNRLSEMDYRLTAMEHGKVETEDELPPGASLDTFGGEIEETSGVSDEKPVRDAIADHGSGLNKATPPALPISQKYSAAQMPAVPLPPPAPTPPQASAAISPDAGALPQPAVSQPLPRSTIHRAKPKQPKDSLEMRIASVWLPWIGLLFLALAAGFLAREYARGPVGKVVFAYIVSFALIIVGLWKERKYARWARPVLAGGLAFSYFTSYAMGFVEPMRMLDSLGLKLVVLTLNIAFIFGIAQWKRSEVIAGTALVLGYITTGVVGDDMAAFSSSLALSIVALLFLWINKWFMSTAIAAAATYIAHLYVWQAMPDSGRSPAELFWFHAMFLSLYFLVYTAAGLVGRAAAREDFGKEPSIKLPGSDAVSRLNVLATLTQVNIGAYIGGMIALLKITEVYWNQAWLFFLPMAVIFGGLGLLFTRLRTIQNMYLVAAVVSATLGIAALLSPMWLPVFMVFQALAMLWGARGKHGSMWQILSLGALLIATLYIVSGGRIDVLRLSTHLDYIKFPWWTITASTVLTLVYSGLWEKRFADSPLKIGYMVPGVVALTAAALWNIMYDLYPAPYFVSAWSFAVPAVAVALVFSRCHWPSFFLLMAGPATLINLWELGTGIRNAEYLPLIAGLAGFGAGLLIEKRGTDSRKWDQWIWRGLYVWGQGMLLTYLAVREAYDQLLLLAGLSFIFTIGAAWLLRTGAMAKSAYLAIPLVLVTGFPMWNNGPYAAATTLLVAGILLIAAYPLATTAWQQRTGDQHPAVNRWGQAAVVFAAGITVWHGATILQWNKVLISAAWAFVAAVFAVAGAFPVIVLVVLAYVVIAGFGLVMLATDVWSGNADGLHLTATTLACVLGVLLIVASERVLRVVPRTRFWSSGTVRMKWISEESKKLITGVVAISTLVMAIISLRLLPDMQNFYFTGAIVASAFVWIVFGFWFNESAYRKSGFAVLCIGLIKGLIWDLWSLKEPIYRVISGAVVGLLAIAASFLYTRFRGRLGGAEEVDESTDTPEFD